MRIEYLYYFLDIAGTLSISSSARHLFISQQGLSRAIQSLEKEFGITLLNRVGNTISLTKAGEEFANTSRELIGVYERLRSQTGSYRDKNMVEGKHLLKIYATPFILNNVFPLFSDAISKQFSHLRINIIEHYPIEISNEVQTSDSNSIYLTNIAISPEEWNCEEKNICFVPIYTHDLMLKVNRDSPLAGKKEITKGEIIKYPLAFFNDEMLYDLITRLLKDYSEMEVLYKTTNKTLLREKVMSGEAISFTDTFSHTFSRDDAFAAIPIKDTVRFYVGFLHNTQIELSPEAEEFIIFIKNAMNFFTQSNIK